MKASSSITSTRSSRPAASPSSSGQQAGEEHEESFIVTDANGQRLAFVYFEPDADNETRRTVMNRLARDEARRIAENIAKLPALFEADKKHNRDDEQES